ncbi:hypothetical protein BIZ78_gp045 [Erwinia phage vB_EamM_Caitlin]|uniref:hypothetical protein n=1 Tax=Erwinia phage vB_EamM_Caitlin TaxID=1883379 RepID=UPI00081C7B68|nr:hypothetical protein BIZ78_gp045 [Erwinia phage vB_EamM_Caitlin]ANZ48530.1 hypothetical protein CAITLIN_235 [Erwinia phage vB_EamM_Caitlin]
MSFKWLTNPLKRYVYKRRRSFLEGEFHKNAHNLYQRVMVGLELITEPLVYGTEVYTPLSLTGHVELRCSSVTVVFDRLSFLTRDYSRVINEPGPHPEWSPYPITLEAKNDVTNRKWLDEYFATQDPEVARDALREIFCLLDVYRVAFDKDGDPDKDVLANRTAHLLRELECIVEHYL